MRTWMGVALLAVSWLLGIGYYYPASPIAWAVTVVFGAVLLSGSMGRQPPRRELWLAMALLIPAVCYASWPWRAAPLLIVIGLLLELSPIPRRWPKRLARGATLAGVVMLVQSLTMALYAAQTARSHELPWPLPEMLAGVVRLLGIEAAGSADPGGSHLVMHSIRQVHRMAASWDLLLDPATLCFYAGALVMLGLAAWSRLPAGGRHLQGRWSAWIGGLRTLALVVALWLPVRAGLLLAAYLHRVLRADDDVPLHVMNLLLSPWVHLLMLLGPVLLAWRFVRIPGGEADESAEAADEHEEVAITASRAWRYAAAVGLVLLAVAVFTAAVHWDPVGTRQAGRVMVVERHSTWEPTDKPYDTTWYGEVSGYNYAAAYAYCGQYFQMSRLLESDKIDDQTLSRCDVLVIKIPTTENAKPPPKDPARYSQEEVDAVLAFVKRGGGLLLIGDHTNVFNYGTYLNDIARPLGFTFRHDLLFGTGGWPYWQLYHPPQVSHPIVQHVPPMDFAVGCSIDPGRSRGRVVLQDTALFSLPSEYHHSNYHPTPQHRPDMRFGAFIQAWSTRYGEGRVVAFTDSTIFSNFCTFQPGKAELLRGMLEWLNHRGPFAGKSGDPRLWLTVLGLVPLAAGLWLARTRQVSWLVLLAAGTCGWVIASVAVAAVGRRAMPVPKVERPMPRVVVDRTLSEVELSNGAFIKGDGEGYGTFETWIPRMGCYTIHGTGPPSRDGGAFSGDALVVICPSRSVSRQYRQQLVRYVDRGGKLLVVDSPENTASTANSLLWPFGLSVDHDRQVRGLLAIGEAPTQSDWPAIIEIERACSVTGGRPFAHLDTTPVGAMDETGRVMAIGFGSLLNDLGMGYQGEAAGRAVWSLQPNASSVFGTKTYLRYNVQFALLRALLSGEPVAPYYIGHVVFDRTVSEVGLPEPDVAPHRIPEDREGFGMLELWPEHLGYSTARGSDAEAFSGDALIVIYPSREISSEFRDRLSKYVAEGGKLLVLDCPDNQNSTANDLLKPFGLSIDHGQPHSGELTVAVEDAVWPQMAVESAWKVDGGEPFAYLGQIPIGATARYKKGAVTAVGFGSQFDNAHMHDSWDLPSPQQNLAPYNLQTCILRSLLTDQPHSKCVPVPPWE